MVASSSSSGPLIYETDDLVPLHTVELTVAGARDDASASRDVLEPLDLETSVFLDRGMDG